MERTEQIIDKLEKHHLSLLLFTNEHKSFPEAQQNWSTTYKKEQVDDICTLSASNTGFFWFNDCN